MNLPLVVMGVAGCGKSSLAVHLAQQWGLPCIEGDDFHSEDNRLKMRSGLALTDADREGWLATLGLQLQQYPHGVVLSCSALKRAYRAQLRAAAPALCFAYLAIDKTLAQERVTARSLATQHFFSSSLVDSQFNTLEAPTGEPGVLDLDASTPLAALALQVTSWMTSKEAA